MVKGVRSLEIMLLARDAQPLRAPRDDNTRADPMLKVIANLEGTRIMTGKNTKKASKRNTAPVPAKAAK